jgi:tungstate transport system substrate-binding protein
MTLNRRHWLAWMAATSTPWANAAQKKSLTDPMRLGVERALFDCGLASSFQKAFGRDTGVAVELVPGDSAALIAALERGEFDSTMTNAPDMEAALEKQGLAHDRRQIALGDLVLVGPLAGKGKKAIDPAGVKGERDIAVALARLAETQTRVIGAAPGSGCALSSQPLWRAAKAAPAAPWYAETPSNKFGAAIGQAAAENAYTLVERAVWLAQPHKALAVLVEGDARMVNPVHVMRSFRVSHPAAKLFGQWVGGVNGRRVAAGVRGWRSPTA